jgi:hypothetical protein
LLEFTITTSFLYNPKISNQASATHSDFPLLVTATAGPLFVDPDNRRYFTDGVKENGKYRTVYLTGSHTWCDFMDCGSSNPPPVFDYNAFLNFLVANHHNFFRLWRAENVKGGEISDNFYFNPMPYQRPGPGTALDGKKKFNVTQFNQTYFDRMRAHIIAARDRGIYVSIMLFDGWSVESKTTGHHPWIGHPFNAANNINGINGDPNGNGSGEEIQTLNSPATATQQKVLPLEEAYVRKVIDTVNDLDNVLYEISNETDGGTAQTAWEYHMINYVKSYEAGKPKQHPVGMTVQYPNGSNTDLFSSPADWISPAGDVNNPPVTDGSKVVLYDTDHLCGLCGNRQFVWKAFTRGGNPLFMDPYDGKATGRGAPVGYDPNNANDVSLRKNLGYTRMYADRMNLTAMTPQPALCSTTYCLVNPTEDGSELLVYLPAGRTTSSLLQLFGMQSKDHKRISSLYLPTDSMVTVDLSYTAKDLTVEWFNPENGELESGETVRGGSSISFTSPFSGDTVLYIHDASLPQPTPTVIQTLPAPVSTSTQTSQTATPTGNGTSSPCTSGFVPVVIMMILMLYARNLATR